MRFICCLLVVVGYMSAVGLSFDLHCSELYIDNTWMLDNVYTCKITEINVTTKEDKMSIAIPITNIDRVRGIWIASPTAHYVPRFVDSLALQIEAFSLWDCRLKSIERSDLKQFPNLKDLWVNYNNLASIDSDLFESSPKLQFITFGENNLNVISANILQPLKHLKYAQFDSEGCINFLADTPTKLETLKSELISKCSDENKEQVELNEVE